MNGVDFQRCVDLEKIARDDLLFALEETNEDREDFLRTQPPEATEGFLKLREDCCFLAIGQLERNIKEIFRATCEKLDIFERLEGENDEEARRNIWGTVIAQIDIQSITSDWTKSEPTVITCEVELADLSYKIVLDQALEYAKRILDLVVAANWTSQAEGAFVVHQFHREE